MSAPAESSTELLDEPTQADGTPAVLGEEPVVAAPTDGSKARSTDGAKSRSGEDPAEKGSAAAGDATAGSDAKKSEAPRAVKVAAEKSDAVAKVDAPSSSTAGAAESGGAPESAGASETPAKEAAATEAEEPRPEIRLQVFGRTDVGQIREHNEDNFLVADLSTANRSLMEGDRVQVLGPRGSVLAVCDGMGGAAAGEVASQLAVDIVYQHLLSGDPPVDHDDLALRVVEAVETAGQRIFAEAKADRSRRGMGTTVAVAALVDDHLFLGNVGDSRGYLLRGERLVQVTRDQSLVNQLIEAGQLTEEEAETFEHSNIILQALGTAESVQVDLTYVELRRGDRLMLCSDGLSGMIRNDEIREVMLAFPDPLEACRELTDRANQAGGHDNVTVVIANFDGPGLAEPTTEDVLGLRYQKYQLPEIDGPRSGRVSGNGHEAGVLSSRPSRAPEIEVGYSDDELPYDDDVHDPIELPHEQPPSWIVTMMIVSAVTCLVVLGYYLLR